MELEPYGITMKPIANHPFSDQIVSTKSLLGALGDKAALKEAFEGISVLIEDRVAHHARLGMQAIKHFLSYGYFPGQKNPDTPGDGIEEDGRTR